MSWAKDLFGISSDDEEGDRFRIALFVFPLGVYVAMHLFIDAGLLSLLHQKLVQASNPVHQLGRHLRSPALIGAVGCQ